MSWWQTDEDKVNDTIDVVETYPNIPWDVWSEEDLWKQSEDPWKQSLW